MLKHNVGEKDEFATRLAEMNKLAMRMDEECNATHPSAWDYLLKNDRENWKKQARKLLEAANECKTDSKGHDY